MSIEARLNSVHNMDDLKEFAYFQDTACKFLSMYCYVMEDHMRLPNMRSVYRMERNDIIQQLGLEKGEFTQYYAMVRGRR